MYKQQIILLVYNKDVVCVSDKNNLPVCNLISSPSRRNNVNIPSHEPYIPSIKGGVFYNCSTTQCNPVKIYSITQIAPLGSNLQICFISDKRYKCEPLNYYKYKDIDKLLFLSNNIPDKTFYLIDCLAYADGGRVCHKKDEVDSHTKLVDTGNIARPSEPNVLSQDEFICQQNTPTKIYCDLNRYVPYFDGLKLKDIAKLDKKILLKTGNSMILLNYSCIDNWCGYIGKLKFKKVGRRYYNSNNRVYKCFYANKQQICKQIQGSHKNVYNSRDWLSSK